MLFSRSTLPLLTVIALLLAACGDSYQNSQPNQQQRMGRTFDQIITARPKTPITDSATLRRRQQLDSSRMTR